MEQVKLEHLLFEIQDVIRSMPSSRDFSVNPDKCIPWLGRASAAMSNWDSIRSTVHFEPVLQNYSRISAQRMNGSFDPTRKSLLVQLHQAESDLRLRTSGPLSVGIETGRVFEYFDEVRKLVESAKMDLFFIDPYIDAEFVSRYLPHVPSGTAVRILAREKISTLKPAVSAFVTQSGCSVTIRTATGFHDRYLLVDGAACYQSGASFKDGAKKAPTTLTQIADAFKGVQATYEDLWSQANPV